MHITQKHDFIDTMLKKYNILNKNFSERNTNYKHTTFLKKSTLLTLKVSALILQFQENTFRCQSSSSFMGKQYIQKLPRNFKHKKKFQPNVSWLRSSDKISTAATCCRIQNFFVEVEFSPLGICRANKICLIHMHKHISMWKYSTLIQMFCIKHQKNLGIIFCICHCMAKLNKKPQKIVVT